MTQWTQVQAQAGTTHVEVAVRCAQPQVFAGKIWRYLPDDSPDGEAGRFGSLQPPADIGDADGNKDRKFMVAGVVVAHGDVPPTPYRIEVEISQNGALLLPATVPEGGDGSIGATDKGFLYRFQVRTS